MISMQNLYRSFNICNRAMTIQSFKFNFRKTVNEICSFWGKLPQKKKTSLTRFLSDSSHNLKGKQIHNSLFDCQACYKSATRKSVLSLFTNLSNKYKVKAKTSGLFYNVKLKKQTVHILHDSNKEYCKICKTTFSKQGKEILGIPNPELIACTIKENIELQTEDTCFES